MGAIAKEHFNLHFFDGKDLSVLPTASVDVISMVHVLHHTGSNQEQLLAEVARVLKPSGVFLIKEHDSTDTEYDLYLNLVHTCKQKLFYPEEEEHMPLGCYRSRGGWIEKMHEAGLGVVKIGYDEREALNAANEDHYRSYIDILHRDPLMQHKTIIVLWPALRGQVVLVQEIR